MDGPTILEEIRKYRREIWKIFLSDEEIQKDIKQMITEALFSVITDLKKSIESLRGGLDELRQEVSALKEQVAKNTQAIQELRQEVNALKEQVNKNTQAIKELRQEVSALKEQVAKNTQAIQELREQVNKNTQAIQELREQVAKNTQAIKELREQVAKNTQAIQELREQVNKNTQAIQELRQEVRENTKSIKELSGYLKEFLHILQEASGLKTGEDLRAFLDAAVYDFGLRVKKYKTKSGRDFDIIITDSKLKPIEIKRTAYDQDVIRFLKAIEELREEFPDKEFLKPMIVCNIDKIKDPELRKRVEIVEFIDVRRIPISSRRIKKIQEKLQESDLFKERRPV